MSLPNCIIGQCLKGTYLPLWLHRNHKSFFFIIMELPNCNCILHTISDDSLLIFNVWRESILVLVTLTLLASIPGRQKWLATLWPNILGQSKNHWPMPVRRAQTICGDRHCPFSGQSVINDWQSDMPSAQPMLAHTHVKHRQPVPKPSNIAGQFGRQNNFLACPSRTKRFLSKVCPLLAEMLILYKGVCKTLYK